MNITGALLDSWDRQCRILAAVMTRIDEANRHVKPSQDGFALDRQLAHIHGTRRFFLSQVAPDLAATLPKTYSDDAGTPIADLQAIKDALKESGHAVREAVKRGLDADCGPMVGANVTYDNPVLLLQHMVWHEGWHVGLIMLALRLNGQEPPMEWEDTEVWDIWRTEKW